MNNIEQDLRERLAKVGKQMYEAGLVVESQGNISALIPNTDTCLIKPSGFELGELKPEDFIIVNIHTREVISGKHKPSIETPFHTTMYKRRTDVGGVVHTHSHYVTLFGIAGLELVPLGMLVHRALGLAKGVGLAKYANPGSEQLAINLAEGMGDRVAVLMPHHGMTAIGKTVEEAYQIAKTVEDLAKLQYEVMAIGKPNPLPETAVQQMLEVAKKRGAIV